MKKLFLTGGTSGIGYSVLEKFSQNDWRVFSTFNKNKSKTKIFKKKFPANEYYNMDLYSNKSIDKTTNKIKLNEVVLETLGLKYLSSNRFKFDYNYCLENLLFFNLEDIPVIEKKCIPENYSKLSFEVDFTIIKPLETDSGFNLIDNCII